MLEVVETLCIWYQQNHRDLPWRKDTEPYHIWISEIMLQQTRVEAVKKYYERFMKNLPNVDALANVEEEELLKLWEGLGYYSRARNLKKAAQKIKKEYQGIFPSTYKELLTLPGIGEYTAGAIASISFHEKVPAIDGNVFRVMMRLENCKQNISLPKTKKELFIKLSKVMPESPGTLNQALMELGATICVPNGKPNCGICPISQFCKAKQLHTQLELPVKNQKKEKEIEDYTVFIFIYYNEIAISKRPAKGILASLYEFVNVKGKLNQSEALEYLKQQYKPLRIKEVKSSKHIFTHKIWNMTNYIVYVEEKNLNHIWVEFETLKKQYAIPSAFKVQFKELEEEMKQRKII